MRGVLLSFRRYLREITRGWGWLLGYRFYAPQW
jgi:hypothetical protein